MRDDIKILKSYLLVESKRLEDILESDYGDRLSDEDYYYDQGRMEACRYILSRLDEFNKEEEKISELKNEYLDKLEELVEMDSDQSTNILETLPLAHDHIIRIFDEAMRATTVEEHRHLMTEGSKQWLRYENLLTDNDISFTGLKEEE